jgi:hypothetical protein
MPRPIPKTGGRIAALLLALTSIGGCVSSSDGGDCGSIVIPPVRSNDHFLYAAEGAPNFVSTNYITDWRTTPIAGSPLRLPTGSRLELALGNPDMRLTSAGDQDRAVQASFWASIPDAGGAFDLFDEWISTSTGHLDQLVYRHLRNAGPYRDEQIRYTRTLQPGLLLAGLFQNQSLSSLRNGALSIPVEMPVPNAPEGHGSLEWSLNQTGGSPCQWTAEVEFRDPVPGVTSVMHVTINFTAGIPMPVGYHYEYVRPDGSAPNPIARLTLKLERWTSAGTTVSPFVPTPGEQTALQLGVPQTEFLDGEIPSFPTPLAVASDTIRKHESAWFAAHPTATGLRLVHRMGQPDGPIADAWTLTWTDESGDGLEAEARAYRTPDGIPALIVVQNSSQMAGLDIPRKAAFPTLNEVGALLETTFGRAEFLTCDFATEWCQGGTHNGTLEPYAAQPLTGDTLPGLIVWPRMGLVLQEDSNDVYPIGAPVAHSLI